MSLSDKTELARFKRTIWSHYKKRGRDLPWRHDTSPYRIFVSEVMLQQTQVSRVAEKFDPFIKKFPSWKKLAAADFSEVYPLWQGLGYNRRARALRDAARVVVECYKGELPHTTEELVELPGIGPATARSIQAFAFNIPSVFIETNIRAVYIHHFFPDRTDVHDRELFPLIEATVSRDKAREWYWALMDYGSELKKKMVNPSRKSVHHVRQSKLEGSLREARGKILKLLADASLSEGDLVKESGIRDGRIELALGALLKEGMVHERGGAYALGT